MFKAGSKDAPERYEGELELEPLQDFVNEMVRVSHMCTILCTCHGLSCVGSGAVLPAARFVDVEYGQRRVHNMHQPSEVVSPAARLVVVEYGQRRVHTSLMRGRSDHVQRLASLATPTSSEGILVHSGLGFEVG